MSKKRGLSLDEKKQKMLEVFHETKDVFVLKELEKLGPTRGVIAQSVKEVVQALVDDDLVHDEKIGSSKYFWSFPSEAAVKLRNETSKLEGSKAELERQCAELRAKVEAASSGREDSAERQAKLAELQDLELETRVVGEELQLYAESDPKRLELLREAAETARGAANRWVDNAWAFQAWCKGKFSGMEGDLGNFFEDANDAVRAQNGVTGDFDHV